MKPVQMMRCLAVGTCASLALMTVSPTAQSQEPDPNIPVTERPRPDFDPIGLRAGSFITFPSVTIAGLFDDNVFATDEDPESDFATLLGADINTNSTWSRNALNFRASVLSSFYSDFDTENFVDLFGGVDGRVDITRRMQFFADAGIGRAHEGRDAPDGIRLQEVDIAHYNYAEGSLGFRQAFNRFAYTIRGGIDDIRRYDDVGSPIGDIDQSNRDRERYFGLLRGDYDVSERLDVFARVVGDAVNFPNDNIVTDPDTGLLVNADRSYTGIEGQVGVDFDITAVFFGELFFGYQYTRPEEDLFEEVDGPSFGAGLTWNPTTLTTLRLDGRRSTEPTVAINSFVNYATDLRLRVDHELLRNLLINGFAAYEQDDFQGGDEDRTDNTIRVGAGLTYQLNRNLGLGANYEFSTRSSDDEFREYDRNRVVLSLVGRL